MKIIAITQARSGSSRLPAKVLKTIAGKTLLEYHLERVKSARLVDVVIVATTTDPNDERIVAIAKKEGLPYYQGSIDDVLDRYYQAAKPFDPDYVVRVTSDCPLIDPRLIDDLIEYTTKGNYDYVTNVMEQAGYPDGQDVEVFRFSALEKAWTAAALKSEREHVTPYIRNNSTYFGKNLFLSSDYPHDFDYTDVRMTVDEPQDMEVIRLLIELLGPDKTWQEYTHYYIANDLANINSMIERAAGYKKSLQND